MLLNLFVSKKNGKRKICLELGVIWYHCNGMLSAHLFNCGITKGVCCIIAAFKFSTRLVNRIMCIFSVWSGHYTLYIVSVLWRKDIVNLKVFFQFWTPWEGNTERVDYTYCSGSWGYIFPYCPADKPICARIDPVENSAVAALENTHSWESDTRRVKFQYYNFTNWECSICTVHFCLVYTVPLFHGRAMVISRPGRPRTNLLTKAIILDDRQRE